MGFFNFSLFDFFDKQIDTAEFETIIAKAYEQIHFKELALFIAISYIANTLSKCEIKVYEKNKEVKNELYYALNVSPNPNQNSSQFMNQIIESYFYTGAALVIYDDKKSFYCADTFGIDRKPMQDNIFENINIEGSQLKKTYKASDVLYFKLDNKEVRSLVDNLFREYSDLLSAAIDSFKRISGRQYKLKMENIKAGDSTFQKTWNETLKKQLKTFMDSYNAVYPQFKGYDLENISSNTASDSKDIIALRKEIFDTTAQGFKIPNSMMYGNITNMKEIVQTYLSFCIDPLAIMISEEFTRKTSDYKKWKEGNYIKVDTSCINHIDVIDVADKVDKAISCGAFCVDEMRIRLGVAPLGTPFGKAHFITKNYLPAEQALLEGGESNNE